MSPQNILWVFLLFFETNGQQIGSTSTSTTNSNNDNIQICIEMTPSFISSRNGDYQRIECIATICGDSRDEDLVSFNQPIFDLNSEFSHIATSNGTCDYGNFKCRAAFNLDLKYFEDVMKIMEVDEMKFRCNVADKLFIGSNNRYVSGQGHNYYKTYTGLRINEYCDKNEQCSDNMMCAKSSLVPGCQCGVDPNTGLQYVEVMDPFEEMICVPAKAINGSCQYDEQCQALDPNSICTQFESQFGTCLCNDDSPYSNNKCQPSRTQTIWWIFTPDLGDHNSHRHGHHLMSLRNVAFIMAMLAILLPLMVILITLMVICFRKIHRERQRRALLQALFPTPRVRKEDLIIVGGKSEKEDKSGLVKNDFLEQSSA